MQSYSNRRNIDNINAHGQECLFESIEVEELYAPHTNKSG